MKKILATMLALSLSFGLTACGGQTEQPSQSEDPSEESQSQAAPSGSADASKNDAPPPTIVDNGFYHDPIKEVSDEVLAAEYATPVPGRVTNQINGVEFVYRGAAELDGGKMAQVDMVINGETVFSFYVSQGSSCYALAPNGSLCGVDDIPSDGSGLMFNARNDLRDIFRVWQTDSSDSFQDEATSITYERLDNQNYSNLEEMRTYLSQHFSTKKVDSLLEYASSVLIEKNGVYYASTHPGNFRFDYVFSIYEPVDIGMDKMTFHQIPYFYEQDAEGKAIGIYQDEITDCVLVRENRNWVFDQYDPPCFKADKNSSAD